jgi:hypothetical protein
MTVSLLANPITRMSPPMLFDELFASIRKHCGRSPQSRDDKQGAEMTQRLHELLELEKPIQAKPAPPEPGVSDRKGAA